MFRRRGSCRMVKQCGALVGLLVIISMFAPNARVREAATVGEAEAVGAAGDRSRLPSAHAVSPNAAATSARAPSDGVAVVGSGKSSVTIADGISGRGSGAGAAVAKTGRVRATHSDCPTTKAFRTDEEALGRDNVLLFSFPGSGNTWLRLLIENATGASR